MLKKLKENLKKYFQFLTLIFLGLTILFHCFHLVLKIMQYINLIQPNRLQQLLGYFGSLISDILLRAFGHTSYFLPFFYYL